METPPPRFSPQTIAFLAQAGRQKNPNWLERNRSEYEELILHPLQHLAQTLKTGLQSAAPGYHFPQKGIGRLRRPANRVVEGGAIYKNWLSYTASRPSGSRFEHNPSIFFMINSEDKDDPVLLAGGLYMPSSRQTRALREAISNDARPFDRLFESESFRKHFPEGFSDERKSSRPPRGFDPAHPRMDWIKLQGFYVWKSYGTRSFASREFAQDVLADARQLLRLNTVLETVINAGGTARPQKPSEKIQLTERLDMLQAPQRAMDF